MDVGKLTGRTVRKIETCRYGILCNVSIKVEWAEEQEDGVHLWGKSNNDLYHWILPASKAEELMSKGEAWAIDRSSLSLGDIDIDWELT